MNETLRPKTGRSLHCKKFALVKTADYGYRHTESCVSSHGRIAYEKSIQIMKDEKLLLVLIFSNTGFFKTDIEIP